MDVQGAELRVLEGLGVFLNDVSLVWLEVENVELYADQPLKEDARVYFEKLEWQKLVDTTERHGAPAGDQLWLNKNTVGGEMSSRIRLLIRLFNFLLSRKFH